MRSAGRNSWTATASSSPSLTKWWGMPAEIVIDSPRATVRDSPPTTKRRAPALTSARLS
jgi:hypothetical protein